MGFSRRETVRYAARFAVYEANTMKLWELKDGKGNKFFGQLDN